MEYGLIGEKLGHSFSKEIHERLGRYSYDLIELTPGELEGFIRGRDYKGLNVTIPYKQAVIPFLDEVSDVARSAGAVNTIVNRNGKLTGYNTDIGGMKQLIGRLGVSLADKTVLIAGSGGTSRTAERAAADLGAAEIIRLSRSGRDGAVTYEEAYEKYPHAEALINTTPAGMYPDVDAAAVDLSRLDSLECVADVIYNPLTTVLVQKARERGIPAENGLYMLVAQAVMASELFTDKPAGKEIIDRIYEEILSEKRNIVLIGMPGSGKTTIGRLLAAKLGREPVDTDDEIVAEEGMPVTDIFSKCGEKYFRDAESRVIRRVSLTGGRIISAGGGAVLRKENRDALALNGRIIFLDRPPEDLVPTEDRPLADDSAKIMRLYRERYPVYKAAADVIVEVRGSEEQTAEAVWRALK